MSTAGIVGILGGGQLARMLAQAALPLGLTPLIYSEEAQCPASALGAKTFVGRITEPAALRDFVARADVVVFENEFVDCAALRAATDQPESKYRPSLDAIGLLQDKLSQKKLLRKLGIPTSEFIELDAELSPARAVERAAGELGGEIFLKWSRQGYDGKGVQPFGKGRPLDAASSFIALARERGIPVYAEKKVDFARELAIIGCRASDGRLVCYPLVISEQESGICREVVGPAIHLGANPMLETKARDAAARIAGETKLVGCLGIELFETRSGELLVNEIAPRVHNSGHYTQNAFPVSQFENHWRAVLGLPLHDPAEAAAEPVTYFAMLNLLGPEGVKARANEAPLPAPGPRSQLHWYAKAEIRPGRKLGHLNGVARSTDGLAELLKELRLREKDWVERLAESRRRG